MNELRAGKSLNQISTERCGACKQNLRRRLKKAYGDEYLLYVIGKLLFIKGGVEYRKSPEKHANRTESELHKLLKRKIKAEFLQHTVIEEVGLWTKDQYSRKLCVADLYVKELDTAIEVCTSSIRGNLLSRKLEAYNKLFRRVICVIEDKKPNVRARRLTDKGIDVYLFDQLKNTIYKYPHR
jgi:hypothetical protein